jgi:hypothetical protein
MRHLEPEQLALPEQMAPKRRARALWPGAAAVIALIIAGGFGATLLVPPSAADNVSPAQAKARTDDFARAPRLQLTAVPSVRTGAAISQMGLPQNESDALATLVSLPPTSPSPSSGLAPPQPKRLGLVELVLWDTDAPDGDVVQVASAGYSREVLLAKTPTVIYVPGTGAGTIKITGVRDGGGGITLGVKGESVSLLMPIMSVGQTLALPVQFP